MDFQELQEIVSVCLDEVVKLREENTRLQKEVTDLQETINSLIESEKKLIGRQNIMMEGVVKNRHIINRSLDNLKYELKSPVEDDSFFPVKVLPIEITIEKLVNEKCSMARFGDGEFSIMYGINRPKFQCVDGVLQQRLIDVIKVEKNDFLVAVADNYGSLEKYNEDGRQEIRCYMTSETRKQHRQFLDLNKEYHNAYISRPYALYADNKTDAPKIRFNNLKRIWEGRDVIFIEGAQTRLGVGNDLFKNAKTVHRIVAPATNSFRCYGEILKAALEFAQKDILFLIALGPSAGVLAYDLYCKGYQAVDIGHLDLEYEWYLNGKGGRCEVKGKYNNEVLNGDRVEDIHDLEYERQIVYRCK